VDANLAGLRRNGYDPRSDVFLRGLKGVSLHGEFRRSGSVGSGWMSLATGSGPRGDSSLDYDLVVCGSGPAGSTAASVAADAGLRTLLVEKRGPPRDKTCGGLLTKACVEIVRRTLRTEVPADVQIPPSPMPIFVVPPSGMSKAFLVPDEYVLNVTRRAFDGWLAREAVARGAEILADSEAMDFGLGGDHVDVRVATGGRSRSIRARYLIGADGVYSKVRQQLRPRPYADRAYYIQEFYPRVGRFEDWFYLMYRGDTSSIYAYVIPKEDLLCLGIGVHKSLPPTFEDGMSRFKEWLRTEFGFRDEGVRKREGFGVPFGNVDLGEGRVLLAGDAAGFCYPPTGEGITFAMQSGAAAARAVAVGDNERVLARYRSEMAGVAQWVQAAADRTRHITDAERERRIFSKAGL